MQELLNNYLPPFVTDNIYVPFPILLILIVEWLRFQFDGIDSRIKPKHLVAIIGLVLAVSCYFIERLEGIELTFKLLAISYFVSTLMYEYLVKPIKEKFFPKFVDKQKS